MTTLFDGLTFSPEHDAPRLTTQLERVRWALSDGNWWMLSELAETCGGSEAGVSARLRDLRKPKFGAYAIERRRRGNPRDGLWEYRLAENRHEAS